MTVKAFIDRVSLLECTERFGTAIRVVRECLVVGLSVDTDDYKILWVALEAAGIPEANSSLDHDEPEPRKAPNLILTERACKLLDDPTMATVTLTYENAINEGQSMDSPL